MKKITLNELMKNHYICSEEEAIEAINFVRELLEEEADYTEETEPYALKSIEQMKKSAQRVNDLLVNFT